jgi:hypothetical protein
MGSKYQKVHSCDEEVFERDLFASPFLLERGHRRDALGGRTGLPRKEEKDGPD